jgi:hypothetical protein
VREDGIEAAQPQNPATWPPGYIEGVVDGLFFDTDGYLDMTPVKVDDAGRLIAGLRDSVEVLRRLINQAAFSFVKTRDDTTRKELLDAFDKSAQLFREGEKRELWLELKQYLPQSDNDT